MTGHNVFWQRGSVGHYSQHVVDLGEEVGQSQAGHSQQDVTATP